MSASEMAQDLRPALPLRGSAEVGDDSRGAGAVRFSLILATIRRVAELDRFLASLSAQKYPSYELIVVDQNADDRLAATMRRWRDRVPRLYLRSTPGLSRARNAGVAHARGEIVGFPDDDGWYHDTFLLEVHEWFVRNPEFSLLSVCARDERGTEVATRWPRRSCPVDKDSLHLTCSSIGLFLHRSHIVEAGGFDERMGLGSGTPFQAAEDLDLAYRVYARHGQGWFEKAIFAHHPRHDRSRSSPGRALNYGAGFGYYLRKHRYGTRVFAYHAARAAAGMVRASMLLRFREAAFHWHSFRGRIAGYAAPVQHSGS